MYLAEVSQISRLGQKAKAILKGTKRPDGLWISVQERTIDLPYSRTWQEKQLLLVELDKNGNVDEVTHASDKLFEALRDWNLRLSRYDSEKVELELLQKSLEYQSAKLLEREEELKRREELQRTQEQTLQTLLDKAQEKIDAANKQHDALTQAWEHLRYRKEQQEKE